MRKTINDSEGRAVAVPTYWLLALPVIIVVPWLIVAAMYWRGAAPTEEVEPLASGPTTSRAARPSGTLLISPIIVSPPMEYVSEEWGRPPDEGLWFFPDTTPEALDTFLSSSGLAPVYVVITAITGRSTSGSRLSGRLESENIPKPTRHR